MCVCVRGLGLELLSLVRELWVCTVLFTGLFDLVGRAPPGEALLGWGGACLEGGASLEGEARLQRPA